MALPDDAPIEELVKAFGVSTLAGALTPAAQRLTKYDLLRLWGTDNTGTALLAYAASGPPPATQLERNAANAGLKLTVEDISSIQRVFGKPTIPENELADVSAETINIYCCCCPCCCATAVLDPVRQTVA